MATVLTRDKRNGNGSRLAVPTAPSVARVGIYCRQSVSDSTSESDSITVQREACEAYALAHKCEGWFIADAYIDQGQSGGSLRRPAMQRLLDDVKARRIDVVVTTRIDRLSRSVVDSANLFDLFEKMDVRLIFILQSIDTKTAIGMLMRSILAGFAEFERSIIRERTTEAVRAARKKGRWTGGCEPIGYRVEAGKLIVEPGEARIVQQLFEVYRRCGSLIETAREANENGWRTKVTATRDGGSRGGVEWSKSSIHRTLTSPLYCGRIIAGGEAVKGEHEPIIDEAAWSAVQEQLQNNAVEGSSGERRRSEALLAGILKCDLCGSAMTPTHCKKGPRRYYFYVCSRRQKGGRSACPAPYVSAPKIEGEYLARIATMATDERVVTAVVEATRQGLVDRKKALADEARALGKSIKDAERDRATLDDPAAVARMDARIAEHRGRLDALQAERAAVDGVTIDSTEIATLLAGSFDQVWAQMTSRERRRVVEIVLPCTPSTGFPP
jgi:site-specific DNA recombinase